MKLLVPGICCLVLAAPLGADHAGDVVTMHFVGWLDNGGRQGKELYNTRRAGKPVSFVVGTDKVMQGWSEGVIGKKPGAGLMFLIDLIAVDK